MYLLVQETAGTVPYSLFLTIIGVVRLTAAKVDKNTDS